MTKEEKLEEVKRLYKTANADQKYVLERLFPELKESEGEKIIKFISNELACLRATEITGSDRYEELTNAIAWLEKQGECEFDCPQNHQDVNRPNGCIVLEDFNDGEGFYKMHLDYLNKKQVEEIEEMVRAWNKEPKASNEDIKNCIGMCLTDVNEQRFNDYNTSLKDCLNWLEKQGEQKSLSEEDENIIEWLIGYLEYQIINVTITEEKDNCLDAISMLKSLKDRVVPQQKQEWGKEDEKMIDNIIDYMKPMPIFFESTKGKSGKEYTKEFIKEATDWLKSLRPQSHWKPSDEQMEALSIAMCGVDDPLFSLYQDLKKLREE